MQYLKSIRFLFLIEGVLIVFGGGISYLLGQNGFTTEKHPILFCCGLILSSTITALIFYIFYKYELNSVINMLRINSRSIKYFIFSLFFSAILYFLLVLISSAFGWYSIFYSSYSSFVSFFLNVIISSLLVGLFEEILYRGLLMTYLLSKTDLLFSIFILSILFSINHMEYHRFTLFILAFLFGIMMSLLVIWSKSLYLAIGSHSGWNLANRIIEYQNPSTNNLDFLLIFLFSIISLLIYFSNSKVFNSFIGRRPHNQYIIQDEKS